MDLQEARFEEADLLRRRELEMKAGLATPADEGGPLPLVSEQEVAEIVASWTGIPVQRLSASSRLRLLHLADSLKASLSYESAVAKHGSLVFHQLAGNACAVPCARCRLAGLCHSSM